MKLNLFVQQYCLKGVHFIIPLGLLRFALKDCIEVIFLFLSSNLMDVFMII